MKRDFASEINKALLSDNENTIEREEKSEEKNSTKTKFSIEDLRALAKKEGFDLTRFEKKTERLQLVLRPSELKKIKRIAKKEKISVNKYVAGLIEKAIEENDPESFSE